MGRQCGNRCSQEPCTPGTDQQAGESADARQNNGFAHEKEEYLSAVRTDGPKQPDLGPPFIHTDGHNREDTHAAHQK